MSMILLTARPHLAHQTVMDLPKFALVMLWMRGGSLATWRRKPLRILAVFAVEFGESAAQRIAMHAELLGGPAQVAFVVSQYLKHIPLLEQSSPSTH